MILASDLVREKLARRSISVDEARQAFDMCRNGFLEDTRPEHQTDPPTLWFIAPTYAGRRLKVVFMWEGDDIRLKTAYEPNLQEEYYYEHGT